MKKIDILLVAMIILAIVGMTIFCITSTSAEEVMPEETVKIDDELSLDEIVDKVIDKLPESVKNEAATIKQYIVLIVPIIAEIITVLYAVHRIIKDNQKKRVEDSATTTATMNNTEALKKDLTVLQKQYDEVKAQNIVMMKQLQDIQNAVKKV